MNSASDRLVLVSLTLLLFGHVAAALGVSERLAHGMH